MDIYKFTQTELLSFALVLLRISAFVVTWPVFGSSTVPGPVKIFFAVLCTFVLYPVIGYKAIAADILNSEIITLAVREVFIGAVIGFISRLFFMTIAMAGQLVSISMGLSTPQLLNPMLHEQSTAIEQFHTILATLFFLSINGHQMFIAAMAKSFEIIPLAGPAISMQYFGSMGPIIQQMLIIGIQLSAPVMISILFMNIAMAVIGRAVPQINVLITSLPVNILVGFFVLALTVPLLVWQMSSLLEVTTEHLFELMKAF